MEPTADIIIHEILELEKMTIRKLAAVTRIKETTMVRLLSGDDGLRESTAYLKLAQYKEKLMRKKYN